MAKTKLNGNLPKRNKNEAKLSMNTLIYKGKVHPDFTI